MRCHIIVPATAGALMFSGSALAQIEVLYTTDANVPTSVVPAGTGLPAGTLFDTFDRPFASPDGSRWIMSALTDFATTTADEIIVVGAGASGAPVVREGMSNADIPALAAGQTLGGITVRMAINDAGQYVFRNSALPTGAGNGYVIMWNGTTFVAVAHEGEAYPGAPAGALAGDTLQSPTLNNAGVAGFFTIATGIPAASNDMGMFGSTIQVQQGFIPTGQIGTPAAPDTFSTTLFYNSEDGSDWLVRCSLPGSTDDDMFVFNGAVIAQEGAVPAGSSFTSPVDAGGLGIAVLMHNGDWFARASNDDGEDWIMRNGVVLATTGDPITTGDTELFDDTETSDCFNFMQGNGKGDYVIAGATNNADLDQDRVMVLNGEGVVLREGMPLDLNGNSLPDDDAFIASFDEDQGFLTDDLLLYCTVTMRSSKVANLGQAFIRVDLGGQVPCLGDTNNSGVVDVDDLVAVILGWGACAECPPAICASDVDGDCDTDVDDLVAVILNWGPCK